MRYLAALTVIFGYAAFRYGGVLRADWMVCLTALAAVAVVYWLRAPKTELAPRPERWLWWPLILLPCYVLLQLVPLPLSVLRVVSPARAELAEGLAPVVAVVRFSPLSAVPDATLYSLLSVLGCVLVFLLAREVAWRRGERPWAAALPVFVVAALEAALGVWQVSTGGPETVARGTYVNRNHFAGLLEMALPFAVIYAAAVMRRSGPRGRSPVRPALKACGSLGVAALMLVAILFSLSRMGFVAALAGLFVAAAVALGGRASRRKKWIAAAAAGALVAGSFIFLPPDQLIARFAELAATDEISADTRVEIWRDTLRLIAAYPVFGCGLGAYESAFLKYKVVAPLNTVDYAHNDYLQGLAELGVVGFAIAAMLAGIVLRRVLRGVRQPRRDGHYFALACAGAMAAILVHSLTDFSLCIPANAMALAWIAGSGCGLQPAHRRRLWKPLPEVIDVEVVH